MTDTEALKALVAAHDKCCGYFQHQNHVAGDGDYAALGRVARNAIPAIERMLASQGEQREAQGAVFTDNGDEIEARLKYDAEHSCPACGGSGHKDDVAPPLAESVGDELNPKALEALKSYQQADRDGIMVNVSRQALDEAIAILERRHMQQGK